MRQPADSEPLSLAAQSPVNFRAMLSARTFQILQLASRLSKSETAAVRPSLEAKAGDQHPAPMALADADPAHGEIAARLAIAFRRGALSEPRPTSLEPISYGKGLPHCVT